MEPIFELRFIWLQNLDSSHSSMLATTRINKSDWFSIKYVSCNEELHSHQFFHTIFWGLSRLQWYLESCMRCGNSSFNSFKYLINIIKQNWFWKLISSVHHDLVSIVLLFFLNKNQIMVIHHLACIIQQNILCQCY